MKNKLYALMLLAAVLVLNLTIFTFTPEVYGLNNCLLTLTVVDSQGAPLSGALARVTVVYGPKDYRSFYNETDESGIAFFNLMAAEPSALVRILWNGVTVALEDVSLQFPESSVKIYCNVSDLNILVLQSNGNPMKNARVRLYWKIDVPFELEAYSNAEGMVSFKRMPYYDGYTLSVEWKGKIVYEDTLVFNGESSAFPVNCNVYDLTIAVVDRRHTPLPEAQITLTREDNRKETKQTDENGIAAFKQLTIGNYTIEISYGTESFQTNLFLASDKEIEISLNTTVLLKYFLEVYAEWEDGKPAKDVNVEVWDVNGEKVASGITNNLGSFKKQLVEGNYTIKISVNGHTESRNITLSHNVTLSFTISTTYRISTLIVTVLDKNGNPASGVQITIYIEGTPFAFGTTNSEGVATFNLPDGTYHVAAAYNGESTEQTVNVNGDQTIQLSFYNPPRMPDILIGMGILSALVLAVFVLILYSIRRREGRSPESYIKELKKLN